MIRIQQLLGDIYEVSTECKKLMQFFFKEFLDSFQTLNSDVIVEEDLVFRTTQCLTLIDQLSDIQAKARIGTELKTFDFK